MNYNEYKNIIRTTPETRGTCSRLAGAGDRLGAAYPLSRQRSAEAGKHTFQMRTAECEKRKTVFYTNREKGNHTAL